MRLRTWFYIVPPVLISFALSDKTLTNVFLYFVAGMIFWIPYWVALFLSGYKVKPDVSEGISGDNTWLAHHHINQPGGSNTTILPALDSIPHANHSVRHGLHTPATHVGVGPDGQSCVVLNGYIRLSNPSHHHH
jgi:hypothetical protein